MIGQDAFGAMPSFDMAGGDFAGGGMMPGFGSLMQGKKKKNPFGGGMFGGMPMMGMGMLPQLAMQNPEMLKYLPVGLAGYGISKLF